MTLEADVLVLGLRGIPGVQGGVETHVEQLFGELSSEIRSVEIVVRTPFVPAGTRKVGALRVRRLWSPTRPGFEALVHSVLAALYAGLSRPDIVHVQAIGPAIVVPLLRMFGLKVVVTHHGADYERDKWNAFARFVLRLGERVGMRCSHARIAISRQIQHDIRNGHGRDAALIPNGVPRWAREEGCESLEEFGLAPGKYVLQVSRIVPEKRQIDLIEAFGQARLDGWKLVFVGGLDDTEYCRQFVGRARATGAVLTGFRSGKALRQLLSHAGLFVLPSSHEGLPIALLEALSLGLPVLASDIPANCEVGLPPDWYFPMGDVPALAARLRASVESPASRAVLESIQRSVLQKYDWKRIARMTAAVYESVLSPARKRGRSSDNS